MVLGDSAYLNLMQVLDGITALSDHHEARVQHGQPWTMDKLPDAKREGFLGAIVGFKMEVQAWRPTFKLSQNAPAHERERVIAGLEAEGALAVAELMRRLVP